MTLADQLALLRANLERAETSLNSGRAADGYAAVLMAIARLGEIEKHMEEPTE